MCSLELDLFWERKVDLAMYAAGLVTRAMLLKSIVQGVLQLPRTTRSAFLWGSRFWRPGESMLGSLWRGKYSSSSSEAVLKTSAGPVHE